MQEAALEYRRQEEAWGDTGWFTQNVCREALRPRERELGVFREWQAGPRSEVEWMASQPRTCHTFPWEWTGHQCSCSVPTDVLGLPMPRQSPCWAPKISKNERKSHIFLMTRGVQSVAWHHTLQCPLQTHAF